MFNISRSGIITINRGDSAEIPIFLNAGNSMEFEEYTLLPNDRLYFGVMEPNQPFECALIRKTYGFEDLDSRGELVVRLRSSDTECLLPGKYYYQIKLESLRNQTTNEYDVETVVDKTLFYIQE